MITFVRTYSPPLPVVWYLTLVALTAGGQEQCENELAKANNDLPFLFRYQEDFNRRRNPNNRTGDDGSQYARILIMHPVYAGSHELILRQFGERMVSRGHQVTQIRWRSTKTTEVESPVEIITLSPDNHDLRYPYMQADGTFEPPAKMLWDRRLSITEIPTDVFLIIEAHCRHLLGDTVLLQRLRLQNFTVAVVDLMANECSLAVAHHLGIPTVAFWGLLFQGPEVSEMGIFVPPSVVPAFMSEFKPRMSFLERVWNSCMALAQRLILEYYFLIVNANIRRLVPSVPESRELLRNVQVVLVNGHWVLDFAKLTPPHVHYIGCIQCGFPSPLPHHLAAWMDSASEGIVLFSLGFTGYESAAVPKAVIHAFMAAFRRLPSGYRVLFRFNKKDLEDIPENVLVIDWFPQYDLLAHPATKLFISHCGINSINEAMYHGVPIVAIPVFADQGDNAIRLREKGVSVVLDKADVTEDHIYRAITTVLNNCTYKENARRLSNIIHEDPLGFMQAARWVEHVHKYRQVNPKFTDGELNLIQYLALDVFAFLLIGAMLPCVVLYLCYCQTSWWMKKIKTN
ncbi:UDP-glucuronosyltransferase 1A9-like [Oratosquilla oratoria]|uniref:UDP-glucuronosyltransferase 1A9-like n=1 Tax=Oratosquilla oratoria TaxID=337810 RepID=UPI003F75B313